MELGRTPKRFRSALGGLRFATAMLPLIVAGLAAGSASAAPGRGPVRHVHRLAARKHAHRAAARGCANSTSPSLGGPTPAMRAAVVCLINRQRVARGLPALRASWRLDDSAQGWTSWMVSHGQFTHGANFSARITAAGFTWRAAGENIATGYLTPQAVVRGWMASTGHCQNILNPTYRDVGTGVSGRGVPGFASGPSTWTQDFGLATSQGAPSGNWGPANGCPYG